MSTKPSYQELEHRVFDWGVDHGIVQNAKPLSQAIKCLEEATALLKAIEQCSESEVKTSLGNTWIALVLTAGTMDMDLQECMASCTAELANKHGFLRADGLWGLSC